MSINFEGAVQVPLSVFGGLVTQTTPPGLPEGASPACNDVVFAPGKVGSRPGLSKVFATPFPAGGPNGYVPTITYAKSYVNLLGDIDNLYLDSNGSLWVEDFSNSPGTYTQIASTTPGSYAKSITAFGREYIAISDKLHGTDMPLQWDGTNLDRVTQDGPGTPPLVSSFAYPSVAMVASSAIVLTLAESDPADQEPGGNYTQINMFTSTSVANVNVGAPVTIAGYGGASAPMNGTWTVLAVYPGTPNSLVVVSAVLPSTTVFSVGAATGTVLAGTLTRSGNVVTASCAAAHQLQVGYQAQIAGIPASTIGTSITSIVINNTDLPGIATVTTSTAHGLSPKSFVNLLGVVSVAVGAGVSSASWNGGVATIVTNSAHGLSPGSIVLVIGGTGWAMTTTVLTVPSTTIFTYALTPLTAPTTAPTAINLVWPIPDTANPTAYEVLAAPTTTTFQIQVNYSDGTWTTGTVKYPWDGRFFVSAVPSSTTFQYQQYGPDSTSSTVGTVTPYGQLAPGKHQCQVLFLTRQGYLTRGSPSVTFTANGGQYASVSNIPIGPSNVVARVLAFTGAEGAYFFYIPAPAQVNGQQVSTATQINDNTTSSVVLDFSDNTLFASLAISVPGNDTAAQIVLDGALGFGLYSSRLLAWGQRNQVQNFLNMSFDGGSLPSSPTRPTGWDSLIYDAQGTLATLTDFSRVRYAWGITVGVGSIPQGQLSQSAFLNSYGAPILTPNTLYKVRVWLQPDAAVASLSFHAILSSASTSFSKTAVITGTAMSVLGHYAEMVFSGSTPAAIPADMILDIYATNSGGSPNGLAVDELEILYAENPYQDQIIYGSYVNNPEAFDGVTGKFGAANDTHKVMEFGEIRDTLYPLTQDPGGRLHQVSDNGVTEPAGWQFREVASNCGLLSAFGLTKSQGDDSSASGGEEWMAWCSSSGARIFGGNQPWKISQEIQPNWDAISPADQTSCWALNDPDARVMYFGVPINGASAPSQIYTLNYIELETAEQISGGAPIRISGSGRMTVTDHTRKWAPWLIAANGGVLMYREDGVLSPVFLGGNGFTPGALTGYGNVYTLSASKLTDDNYGQIFPTYTTYFFLTDEQEQQYKLGGGRKLLAYVTAFISGVGIVQITPYCNTITNPWPVVVQRYLQLAPTIDLECGGGSAISNRIALQIASGPLGGSSPTDNAFVLQNLIAAFKVAKHLPIRGSAA